MSTLTHLRRWLRRAAPERRELLVALVAGVVANLVGVALLIGAVDLLIVSAGRPGLRAVAGVLILIELFAFLRSPLRYGERMASHRLGFSAVTTWRQWLMSTVGTWSYGRARRYAAGDLLERALADTDQLQDLWLRFVLPLTSALVVMVVADVVTACLPGRGWLTVALGIALSQVAGLVVLVRWFTRALDEDRRLRHARSSWRATLVEMNHLAPDLALLGQSGYVDDRLDAAAKSLAAVEARVGRQRYAPVAVGLLATGAALASVTAHLTSRPVWLATATLVALSTFELFDSVQRALQSAVAVAAAAERLDQLEITETPGALAWPEAADLELRNVGVRNEGHWSMRGITLAVTPGRRLAIVGPSGSGKSSLLRLLAGLEHGDEGEVLVNGRPLGDYDETSLRHAVGYCPADVHLVRGYRRDTMLLGREAEGDVESMLRALGLDDDLNTFVEDLSRGERERFGVVRALVTSPRLVLLDEPTAGLGATDTQRVLDLVARSSSTVVVATHDPLVIAWCDEVFDLATGTFLSR